MDYAYRPLFHLEGLHKKILYSVYIELTAAHFSSMTHDYTCVLILYTYLA